MQTKIITIENIALYPGNNNEDRYEIDLDQLTGSEIDYAIVHPINITVIGEIDGDYINIRLHSSMTDLFLEVTDSGWIVRNHPTFTIYNKHLPPTEYTNPFLNKNLYLYYGGTIIFDITFAITAQFQN